MSIATTAHHENCTSFDQWNSMLNGAEFVLGCVRIVLHRNNVAPTAAVEPLHCFCCGDLYDMQAPMIIRQDDMNILKMMSFTCRRCELNGGGLYMQDLITGSSQYTMTFLGADD